MEPGELPLATLPESGQNSIMASKYERRRRALKETQVRGENPYASPRAGRAIEPKTQQPQPMEAGGRRAGRSVVAAICCLLALAAVVVYAQTARFDFVNCDDNEYVYANAHIQHGLNLYQSS